MWAALVLIAKITAFSGSCFALPCVYCALAIVFFFHAVYNTNQFFPFCCPFASHKGNRMELGRIVCFRASLLQHGVIIVQKTTREYFPLQC